MKTESPVDHLIVQEMEHAKRLRREVKELSHRSLARKFGLATATIGRIAKGMEHEDGDIVRACLEEGKQLQADLARYTERAIAERYGCSRGRVCYVWQELGEVTA